MIRSVRRLTDGERAAAREMFGRALDPEPVRIAGARFGRRVFVPGRLFGRDWIVWPVRDLRPDFAEGPLNDLALLIHELAHVWQAQRGVFLPFAKLRAGDAVAAYAYAHLTPDAFARMNIEQQASAIEHAFLLKRGGRAPWPVEAYAAALPFETETSQVA